MDRKRKIQELKRKNSISILCKRWKANGIDISIEDFLSLEETLFIQNRIMNVLEDMDIHNKSLVFIKDRKKSIGIYKEKLMSSIYDDGEYNFFEKKAAENGCVVIGGTIIKTNIDFIIKESELFDDYGCSVFFCNRNVDKGVCLWSGEYDDRIYIW